MRTRLTIEVVINDCDDEDYQKTIEEIEFLLDTVNLVDAYDFSIGVECD